LFEKQKKITKDIQELKRKMKEIASNICPKNSGNSAGKKEF